MLLSEQATNNVLFFTRECYKNMDTYLFISQSYFHLPKNKICTNSNKKFLFKQTLKDIILIFHDIAGLGMTLQEWISLCCKARQNVHDYF